MEHYDRIVKCHNRDSQFFGNFVEDNAGAFGEAMSYFGFAEIDKLGLPVDDFRIAVVYKVSMCWCIFRRCNRVDLWRRCGWCVGFILRSGGKIASLTDEARVVTSSGCQTTASYMTVAALVAPYNSTTQMPVAFCARCNQMTSAARCTIGRLICHGIEGKLSGQVY